MARNKLVDMIGKLSEEQVERLSGIAMEYLDLNTEVEDTTPKSCPCCGAANAQKFETAFYANPDLRGVRPPEEPKAEPAALVLASLVEQLQKSPELAKTLAALISAQTGGRST